MSKYNPVDINVFDLATAIIPDPGANTNFSWSVPANSRVQILYVGFIFASDANAANRYITLLGSTPTLSQTMGACSVAQIASKTYGWGFNAGLGMEIDLSAANRIIAPMSPSLILEEGDSFESNVLNMQAGDAITSIICRYKQWVVA